jgi:hypothetical protein
VGILIKYLRESDVLALEPLLKYVERGMNLRKYRQHTKLLRDHQLGYPIGKGSSGRVLRPLRVGFPRCH